MLVDNLERSFEPSKVNLFSSFCEYPCPPQSALIRDSKSSGSSFSIETILGKRTVPVDRGKSADRVALVQFAERNDEASGKH